MGQAVPSSTSGHAKRLLIVACDFDADAAPQGLRWVNLSHELASLGWEVDVLTWQGPLARTPDDATVRLHHAFPGPYHALIAWARRRRLRRAVPAKVHGATPSGEATSGEAAADGTRLNWKGRLERRLHRLMGWLMYPDMRREGLPFLRSAARQLVARNRYAAVVLSHEPPFALELLETVAAHGAAVVVDLGDPVCATYTPWRWRRRALRLEARACVTADAIVVTSEPTRRLLEERHGPLSRDCSVITQGFHRHAQFPTPAPAGGRLRLVYTGRFYRFRDPRPVIEAVMATDGVDLELAVPELPDWLEGGWRDARNIRLHRRLTHAEARELQRTADVLLVIGNDDPTQTPGKLFEYFAVPAPILYVARHPDDPAAHLVEMLRRGRVVGPDGDQIVDALRELHDLRAMERLAEEFDLSDAAVGAYSWSRLAQRYDALLTRLISRRV